MAATTITESNFEQTVTGPGITILDWWAPWCGPCKSFAPIFEAASEKHADITWGKINTDEEGGLAAAFEIRSIPTLMVFKEGVLIFEQPGLLPPQILEQLVTEVRALDMAEVRKKIEEELNRPRIVTP
ncbi:MAG: putative thioredoxin 2 [Myxococcota bacterium]|nr:putative thioredoxin 2 [Myxococcota bacterium]